MNVVLFLLALAMLASGVSAFLSGWQFVIMEKGATMVVAGTVFATGGAVLLGLSLVARRVKRLTTELRDAFARQIELAQLAPAAAVAAPLPALDVPETAGGSDERRAEIGRQEPPVAYPAPSEPAEQGLAGREPRFDVAGSDRMERFAPTAEPVAAPPVTPEPVVVETPVEPASTGPAAAPTLDEPPVEPAVSATPVPPEEPAPEPPAAPKPDPTPRPSADLSAETPAPRTIVGRYASGDNSYVMYADGSVLAVTPAGDFEFGSLDELKDFIDRGARPPVGAA